MPCTRRRNRCAGRSAYRQSSVSPFYPDIVRELRDAGLMENMISKSSRTTPAHSSRRTCQAVDELEK